MKNICKIVEQSKEREAFDAAAASNNTPGLVACLLCCDFASSHFSFLARLAIAYKNGKLKLLLLPGTGSLFIHIWVSCWLAHLHHICMTYPIRIQ